MTALLATPQPATATAPPSMLLSVTAAPNPPATAYTSNFTAGVDSWANAGSATLTGNVAAPVSGIKSLQIDGPATTADATAQRALTGLTIAAPYRYRTTFEISRGEVKLIAKDTSSGTVLAQTSFVTYSSPTNKTVVLALDFVPTAATVTIQIVIHQVTAFGGSVARVYANTISVSPTGAWLGTTVYRTDANGTDVPVREDVAGQDTAGGTMTLTDWEAALNGPVAYRVVDGAGVSTAAAIVSHSEARRNVLTNPRLRPAAGAPTNWSVFGVGATLTGSAATGALMHVATAGTLLFPSPTYPAGNRIWSPGFRVVGPGLVRLEMESFDGGGSSLGLVAHPAGYVDATNGVTLTWDTATVNAAAASVRPYLRFGTVADFQVSAPMLINAATVGGAAFDGATANVGPVMHYWLGAVDASASVETAEMPALGVWVTVPTSAVPSVPTPPSAVPVPLVTGYDETASTTGSVHQIVGRADKIANPGPLSTRSGQLELFVTDYAAAKAVRTLLRNGDVAMLRQPTHPGLDLYFTTTSVRIDPRETTSPLRFQVTVSYEEVVAP